VRRRRNKEKGKKNRLGSRLGKKRKKRKGERKNSIYLIFQKRAEGLTSSIEGRKEGNLK